MFYGPGLVAPMTKPDAVLRALKLSEAGQARAAFRMLLRAARRGDATAFISLGYAYDTGSGVRPSKAKALYWYARAEALGEAAGAHNIATIFRDRGDIARMVRWLRRAVELGDSGSNLLLGQLVLAHDPAAALASFSAVGPNAFPAEEEAAVVWRATAQGMLAAQAGGSGRA